MAKLIEFDLHGPVPKKVKPIPIEQRGKLVEFLKENFDAQSKTEAWFRSDSKASCHSRIGICETHDGHSAQH
jgi:hypothetical protein